MLDDRDWMMVTGLLLGYCMNGLFGLGIVAACIFAALLWDELT